ncbi:hypothetical protein [Methylorubrum extorquens]|uniref:hypothetical protein n=1 Tax=Methylorubrum extorquens TaxID=408 RepID=UPI0002FFBDF5|nr:hypothetical protein [Methylorubrum extorquens]MCP1545300.1 hypothetical protein [Methylorubrum extorquens]MCP1587353.1 hypothetical protein [Methylorubrum extorquens]
MLSVSRGVVALCAALLLASSAYAQSKDDIASKINSTLPDNGRGQITAAGLRGLMNSLNSARGVPYGLAELGPDGRLVPNQGQSTFDALRLGPALSPLDLTYAGVKNPNVMLLGVGNQVSFCPALSCINGPPDGTNNPAFYDHQRASFLLSAQTQIDGQAEEQTLGVTTTIKTGYARPYQQNTAYALGDNVNVGNATYRVTQAGTTGGTAVLPGSRPNSAPFSVNDGSVRWLWINDAAINAKVGIYNETEVVPGGGQSWSQANNFMLQPGVIPTFHTNLELDFTNNSGTDCVAGVSNCLGMFIRMAGSNRNTSAISIEGVEASARSLFGIRFSGPVADTTIDLGSDGGIGLGIGTFTPASFTSAAISDASTAPAGINMVGAKSLAGIRVATNGPAGIDLRDGVFTAQQIVGKNWVVDPAGAAAFANLTVAGQIYEPSPFVPSASNTACTTGQRSWDASYEYRCVATNTWKRTAYTAGGW